MGAVVLKRCDVASAGARSGGVGTTDEMEEVRMDPFNVTTLIGVNMIHTGCS